MKSWLVPTTLRTRIPHFAVLAGILFAAYPLLSRADCSRSDVEFYLSEGFTPDQITALCTAAAGNRNATGSGPQEYTNRSEPPQPPTQSEAASPKSDNKQEGAASGRQQEESPSPAAALPTGDPKSASAAQLLQAAIKGRNISVTGESLRYTQDICISYEHYEYFPSTQVVVCPEVAVTIARRGLRVLGTENKAWALEGKFVKVSGDIEREILDTFRDKEPKERKLILDAFGSTPETRIRVEGDVALEGVVQALRQIAR